MNPILQDKNLAIILAGIGAKHLMKKAQTAPQTNSQVFYSDKFYQAADYLASELQNQLISPISAEPHSVDPNAPMQVHISQLTASNSDFDSLTSLAGWLASNKITFQNQRIAWHKDESHPDDAVPAGQGNVDDYINKKMLLEYLSYLRDNQATNNKSLQMKLNGIISEVNSTLLNEGETPLSNKPVAAKPAGATSANTAPTAATAVGPGGTSNINVELVNKTINNMLMDMPLSMQDIDMARIKRFFESYFTIVSIDYKNSFESMREAVYTSINKIASLTPINQVNFPLTNLNISIVVAWAKPPNQGPNGFQILEGLIQVISYTKQSLQLFSNNYGDKHPQLANKVQAQLSIADNTIELLRATQQRLTDQMRNQQK